MWSKSLLLVSILASSPLLQVAAHGTFAANAAAAAALKKSDVVRAPAACDAATALASPIPADSTGTFNVVSQSFDKGADGATTLKAGAVDTTAQGTTFSGAVTEVSGGDAAPATEPTTGNVVMQLPAGTKCAGGSDSATCLVSLTTSGGFQNCLAVTQASGAGATAGSAADAAASNSTADASAADASSTDAADAAAATDATATDAAAAAVATDATATDAAAAATATETSAATGDGTALETGAGAAAAAAGAGGAAAAAAKKGKGKGKGKKAAKKAAGGAKKAAAGGAKKGAAVAAAAPATGAAAVRRALRFAREVELYA